MKTFITQHRSTTLQCYEQKHLVTRAMDGLKSDRYRQVCNKLCMIDTFLTLKCYLF